MTLNWTPEVVFTFLAGIIMVITAIIVFKSPKTKNIRSVKYLTLSILFGSVFHFSVSLSVLLLNELLTIFYNLLTIGMALFITIAINYIMKDRIYSTSLLIVITLSSLMIFLASQSPVVSVLVVSGFYTTVTSGYFFIFSELLAAFMILYTFYWGIKTYLYSPPLIKKEAKIFFLGVFLMSIITLFIYYLYFLFPVFLIIYPLVMSIGISIFMTAIIIEPKLLYILPFEVHRILVKDREGFPLFDHDWSESSISDNIFSGFINAVQIMSEEVINKGGILDIILSDGILILRESEFITVGLVASKPSKLLRESLIHFSDEFESKFMRLLKSKCREMDKYDDAYLLLEKYFSNFPSKLVSDKENPLYLTLKYKGLTPELENKMKEIFTNEQEYEDMKKEILTYPEAAAWHFLKFYEENRDKIPYEGDKILEDNNS
ncbi:MAG: hypothetical protein ACXABG_15490 [Promethearchaeota archaeon]|jgi:hypothetical protein